MSRITGATAVAGIVGRPVRHSMSPILHNAWLAGAGLDGVYVPFSPTAETLPTLIQETMTAQSAHINIVSGASDTSDAFGASLQSALLKANAS